MSFDWKSFFRTQEARENAAWDAPDESLRYDGEEPPEIPGDEDDDDGSLPFVD